MRKYILLLVPSIFFAYRGFSQTNTRQYVDSIIHRLDSNTSLKEKTYCDSSALAYVVTLVKEDTTLHLQRIEEERKAGCQSHFVYYFFKCKLIKVVAKMNCSGGETWDSELYYENEEVFSQTDRGTMLYGPAFQQYAYNAKKSCCGC